MFGTIYPSYGYVIDENLFFNLTFAPNIPPGNYEFYLVVNNISSILPNVFSILSNSSIDSTSLITCFPEIIKTGTKTTCLLFPKLNGNSVYTLSTSYSLPDTDIGVFSVLPFSFNYMFVVDFTSKFLTGFLNVTDGISSPFTMRIYGVPDNSSSMSCDDINLQVLNSCVCRFFPKINSSSIYSHYSFVSPTSFYIDSVSPVLNSGFFVSSGPIFSTELIFNYTSSSVSGTVSINGFNFSNIKIIIFVYGKPDSSSYTYCTPLILYSGDIISCWYYSKMLGYPVFTYPNLWPLTFTQNNSFINNPQIKLSPYYKFTIKTSELASDTGAFFLWDGVTLNNMSVSVYTYVFFKLYFINIYRLA